MIYIQAVSVNSPLRFNPTYLNFLSELKKNAGIMTGIFLIVLIGDIIVIRFVF
jgi:hypothetical protein